jgi:hypothetical protein
MRSTTHIPFVEDATHRQNGFSVSVFNKRSELSALPRTGVILCGSAIVLAVFSGCASVYPPKQIGPDRYQTSSVSSFGRGSIARAQRVALDAADAKCTSLGKGLTVAAVDTDRDDLARGRATVTFECE